MAVFMADRKILTLTIHKENCPEIPGDQLLPGRRGSLPGMEDQCWYDEEDLTERKVILFMEGRYFTILLCETCFGTR